MIKIHQTMRLVVIFLCSDIYKFLIVSRTLFLIVSRTPIPSIKFPPNASKFIIQNILCNISWSLTKFVEHFHILLLIPPAPTNCHLKKKKKLISDERFWRCVCPRPQAHNFHARYLEFCFINTMIVKTFFSWGLGGVLNSSSPNREIWAMPLSYNPSSLRYLLSSNKFAFYISLSYQLAKCFTL